jgi:hypothetical protein
MDKEKTDYSKTIIYKIVCNDLNIADCYVGHTVNFIKRKLLHKSSCNNQNCKGYNNKIYKFIRNNGNWNNWSMIEIKKYPCNDKREAESEERRFYEELNCTLITNKPFITKDELKDNQKKYNKENKEKINNFQKKYRKENKAKNKDYNKNYYEKNKEKISINNKIKFNCKCGGKYAKGDKSRHLKSKKHLNYIINN